MSLAPTYLPSMVPSSRPLAPVETKNNLAMAGFVERSRYWPLLFSVPMIIALASWFMGGVTLLTDFAFVLVTLFCTIGVIAELRNFSYRWGIGGLLVFGGSLVWFCYDYLSHWAFSNRTGTNLNMPPDILAKAAFYHCLYIIFLLFGLRVTFGKWLERALINFPDPQSERFYVVVIGIMFIIGMSPYAIFTNDNFIEAIYKDVVAGRGGQGASWQVGRTGNLNYSFGAYVAQILQVGTFAGVLGVFYAVMVAKSWSGRIYGLFPWLVSLIIGFGTGTRGALVMVLLPAVGSVFLKYQSDASRLNRRMSLKAYSMTGLLLFAGLVGVQTQITFRDQGFKNADLNQVSLTDLGGNSMFSESLQGFYLIPNQVPIFWNNFAGLEAIYRPIPDTIYWFFVTPIPRAIWTTKPIDPVWEWYNRVITGNVQGTEGTTVVNGAVGYWYFRAGLWGVIEGGLVIGWMMGLTERVMRNNNGKAVAILVGLGLATWLFRVFRSFNWIELHATLVGMLVFAILVIAFRPLFRMRKN